MRAGQGLVAGLAAAIAMASLLASPSTAMACTCMGPQSGDERKFNSRALAGADAAVFAKVLRIEELNRDDGLAGGPADYVLRVRRGYKKPRALARGKRIKVRAYVNGATCGLGERTGVSYGLLLRKDSKGRWVSNLCSMMGRKQLRRAWRDLRRQRAKTGARSRSGASPVCPSRSNEMGLASRPY